MSFKILVDLIHKYDTNNFQPNKLDSIMIQNLLKKRGVIDILKINPFYRNIIINY